MRRVFLVLFWVACIGPIRAQGTTTRQVWPVLETDGVNFLELHAEQSGNTATLIGAIVDRNGAKGRGISFGPVSGVFDPPYNFGHVPYGVAFGTNTYLVAWQKGTDVVAVRVDRVGNLLDLQPLLVAANAQVADGGIAWNGSAFFVAGSFVSEAGAMVGRMGPNVRTDYITFDGTRFLTSWPLPPGIICTCLPSPADIALMRVTADGNAIDSGAVIVHLSAYTYRIATNGRDFVVASDTLAYDSAQGYVSRIELRRVNADGATLQVDTPITAFAWPQSTISDIVWNGRQYVLVFRYSLGTRHWLGLMRLNADLTPDARFYIDTVPDIDDRVAIAANLAGDEVVETSEKLSATSAAQVVVRNATAFRVAPAPPPAPLITSATGTAQSTTITWLQSPITEVSGFIIENVNPYANFAVELKIVDGNTRTATVSIAQRRGSITPHDYYVRLRAFNPGGVSEPTAAFPIAAPPRTRSAQH